MTARIIKFGSPQISELEISMLEKVTSSGIFVHGEMTKNFELTFAQQFGYDYVSSVANCTAGLHLAHFLLNQRPRHKNVKHAEVICPAMTHVATAHAIELAGLTPVFVDCNYHDGNIDVEKLESQINENTVGIAPMHFNGVPCDMNAIMLLAKKYSLYVVEDCAIALGAKINGQPVGTFGDVGAFSFHPVKQMTTGEGGMLVANSKKFIEDVTLAKAFGVNKSFSQRSVPGLYDVTRLGFNYRMAEMPAAIGLAQLQKYGDFSAVRLKNFEALSARISKNKKLTVKGKSQHPGRSHYCLIVQVNNCGVEQRNSIILRLKKEGIESSIYYPHPVPRLDYYNANNDYAPEQFKNAEIFSDQCISLPIGPHLDIQDMDTISNTLETIIG